MKQAEEVMGGQNPCLFTAEQLRCLGRLKAATQRHIKERVDDPCSRPTSHSYSTGCPSRRPAVFPQAQPGSLSHSLAVPAEGSQAEERTPIAARAPVF